MPDPKAGESESEFISRCVPIVMDEGRTQQQALGKCYGIWRGKHGGAAKGKAGERGVPDGSGPEGKGPTGRRMGYCNLEKTQDTDFAAGFEDYIGECNKTPMKLLRSIVQRAMRYVRHVTG